MSFWDLLSHLSDIFGVIGFSITAIIGLWINGYRKQQRRQKSDYIKHQSELILEIKVILNDIYAAKELQSHRIGSLRELLFTLERSYGSLHSLRDRYHIRSALHIIKKQPIDLNKLCIDLNYLSAILNRKGFR